MPPNSESQRNTPWQTQTIDQAARSRLKSHGPLVIWITGIPASGKSTLANRLEARLHAMGRHTYLLDGDNLRHGLNQDLGFSQEDRVENVRRVAEVARLMADAGLVVIAALISPYRSQRQMARSLMPEGRFLEVFVDTPLTVAESRDPKGHYKRARSGSLDNFTGVGAPYEPPENPDVRVDGATLSPDKEVDLVIEVMLKRGL